VFRVAAGAKRMMRTIFERDSKKSSSTDKPTITLTNDNITLLGTAIIRYFPQIWLKVKEQFPKIANVDWPLISLDGTIFELTLRHLDAALCMASKFWDILVKGKSKKIVKFYPPTKFALTPEQREYIRHEIKKKHSKEENIMETKSTQKEKVTQQRQKIPRDKHIEEKSRYKEKATTKRQKNEGDRRDGRSKNTQKHQDNNTSTKIHENRKRQNSEENTETGRQRKRVRQEEKERR